MLLLLLRQQPSVGINSRSGAALPTPRCPRPTSRLPAILHSRSPPLGGGRCGTPVAAV